MTGQVEQFGDWNDLAVREGAAAVIDQLTALVNTPDPQNGEVPSEDVGEALGDVFTLDVCLQRFVWTTPDGKIYDTEGVELLRPSQLKGWLGAELYTDWHTHQNRRVMEHYQAVKLCAASSTKGGRGNDALTDALERFALIYPSQDAWDRERHEIVAIRDVAVLLGETFTQWSKHPRRAVYARERVVFDPTQSKSPADGYLNMFRGLDSKPVNAPDKCMAIRRLIDHLVNHDDTIFEWLMCWLAYPLQNVGAKMSTMVLMHSKMQGGGKSLFFEECYKPIFGEYSATVGQAQMESQYTEWRSKMLFGLFEEVLNRGQKFNHIGEIKHMVSGKTQRIEKKFVSGWEEQNHMNFVFLSNEVQPLYIERHDRRTLVVYPNDKLDDELKEAVLDEIANGGVEAFHGWLLRWKMQWKDYDGQLKPFARHTEPPMTDAKLSIITYGLSGFDLFADMWSKNDLPDYPFEPVAVSHLYLAYKDWCSRWNERAVSLNKFSIHLSHDFNKKKDVWYWSGANRRKTAFFMVADTPENEKREDWLGKIYDRWERQLNSFGGAQ